MYTSIFSSLFFSLFSGTNLIFIVAAIILFVVIFFLTAFFGGSQKKPEYQYRKKDCIMTESEGECFKALFGVVGDKYYIFPQVHLPAFLDHKIKNGQYWQGAFRHIDEKSVDFVLCDKQNLSPKLAIELDDWSHERYDRQERDREVERILKDAGMPLLRIPHGELNPDILRQGINAKIV